MFGKLLFAKKHRHTLEARSLHWIYAPAVLTGLFSGFYISNVSRRTGYNRMDQARKNHFIAQYMLIFSYLARIYYAGVSRNYSEIIPGIKDYGNLPGYLKYELFLTSKKPTYRKYNPAQKIIFTLLALMVPVQIVTGLVLYASNALQKPAALAGGVNPLRQIHYLAALSIASLTAGHIYFALTHSLKKLKSIFTGYE